MTLSPTPRISLFLPLLHLSAINTRPRQRRPILRPAVHSGAGLRDIRRRGRVTGLGGSASGADCPTSIIRINIDIVESAPIRLLDIARREACNRVASHQAAGHGEVGGGGQGAVDASVDAWVGAWVGARA